MVKLGDKVTDSLTGFSGIATARTEYLYGCPRVTVEPAHLKDGAPIPAQHFDEPRLTPFSASKSMGIAYDREPQ